MCLILFTISSDPQQRLVVAANRDEQHARPTARAGFWRDNNAILGGRDLQANGTWLGVNKNGRFAAVTNFAETPAEPIPARTRGELTSHFLNSDIAPEDYLSDVDALADQYRGFNLVLFDGNATWYYSNRAREIKQLTEGHYGLSNQLLDCNWPKVNQGRESLKEILSTNFSSEKLFDLLAHRGDGQDHSARFILGEHYGTSVATVVRIAADNLFFEERGFRPDGSMSVANQFQLNIN
jgi:uncharacterized protein with NRDE domain|tara:strand:- start:1942 stop:2655 length:714 start_codon:yes stop_codon:yes gene_type:complete